MKCAVARRDHLAQDALGPAIVGRRAEDEAAALLGPVDRPAGEAARDLDHVLLRVAAVHSEGVQLHELAGVVLVEPHAPARVGAAGHHEVGARAEPVVEVEEHRGMTRGGQHEVAEPPERVRPDRLPLVGRQHPAHRPLLPVDVEVIEPEVHHHFLELPVARDRARDPGRLHLPVDDRGPALGRIRLHDLLAAHLARGQPLLHLRAERRIVAVEGGRALREHRIGCERLLHRRIRNPARVELPLDVRGEAHPPHPLDVARSRSVAEPVQGVEDDLIRAEGRGGQPQRRRDAGRRSGRRRGRPRRRRRARHPDHPHQDQAGTAQDSPHRLSSFSVRSAYRRLPVS